MITIVSGTKWHYMVLISTYYKDWTWLEIVQNEAEYKKEVEQHVEIATELKHRN